MNQNTRVLSLVLILALLLSAAPVSFAGTEIPGVGSEVRHLSIPLHLNATLHETTLLHTASGRQEERYIEWGGSSPLTAAVQYGATVHGGNLTLAEAAQKLRSQGLDVVAGLNADFFFTSNGVPCGVLITDGVLRCSDNGQPAVGFPSTGGSFISWPQLNVTASAYVGGVPVSLAVKHVNRVREDDGIYLYTPDFAATTRTVMDGLHVVLQTGGNLTVGGTVTGTVLQTVAGKDAYTLTPGQMVLSCTSAGPISQLQQLAVGQSVELRVTANDPRWQTCRFAAGGQYALVTGGTVKTGLPAGTAPRTAVGVRPDGTTVFYTVDGRQSEYSAGLTLTDVARRLIALGCEDVLELDGGGSTIMAAQYPGLSTLSVLGRPSDGQPRKSTDFIFLCNTAPVTGGVGQMFVYPNKLTMLRGASVKLTAAAADHNFHAVPMPAASWSTDNSMIGSVGPDGGFNAAETGSAVVSASYGGATGYSAVSVVGAVDSIRLRNERTGREITSLSAAPEEVVNLQAAGYLDSVAVHGTNPCFTWAVQGNIGTVTPEGVFTASSARGGEGTITVSYGMQQTTLPVTVGRAPEVLDGFETGTENLLNTDGRAVVSRETNLGYVRYGRGSARVEYNLGTDADTSYATLTHPLALQNSPEIVYFWVYGDGSGNVLSAQFADLANMPVELSAGVLDYRGWRMVPLTLPPGTNKLTGWKIAHGNAASGQATSGVIWLDQITAGFSAQPDLAPPTLQLLSLDMLTTPWTLSIQAQSGTGAALKADRLSLKLDGQSAAFSYDPLTARLTASVNPLPAGTHLFTAEAMDSGGNRARLTYVLDLPDPAAVSPFTDVTGHWGASYIHYLDAKGCLTVAPADGGERRFGPDQKLTRAEMAVFLTRVMKIDLTQYEAVVLPFTDLEQIPAGALPYIKAAYALGLVTGKTVNNGPLYFDAFGTVSRADFMTIVGRSLPKGYGSQTLQFSDMAQTPAYAREYVELLVHMGIVSGNTDNTLTPLREVTRAEAAKMLFFFY